VDLNAKMSLFGVPVNARSQVYKNKIVNDE
jgi:hypothetical protein